MKSKTHYTPLRFKTHFLLILCAAALLLPFGAGRPVRAQTGALPAVAYDAQTNTVLLGGDYTNPTFAGFPAHPDAPKDAITIPQLKIELDALGQSALLTDIGGAMWLLKADIVINPTARLDVTSPVKVLRLDSTPNEALNEHSTEEGAKYYTTITAHGGQLHIEDVVVTSWNTTTGKVDIAVADGRSYLLAFEGGQMDILDAEVAYLGWSPGEPSGLAWRQRATDDDPKTGATGSILRSDIHQNYFGQYSYEAWALVAKENKFRDNIYYGFDPHDFSSNFEVAYNQVYNNGKHGIIFSRGCENNKIHNNTVYGNAEHGIMLDRGTNNNQVYDNIVYNNQDGIAIFQSSDNRIENNTAYDNNRGLRINATYDDNDIYDGLATGNTIVGNTFKDNTQYGVYFYNRADQNTIQGNTITGNDKAGIYIKTGGNVVEGNTITNNGDGIDIVGGPADVPTPGTVEPVQAKELPGHNNRIIANIITDNTDRGVQVKGGVNTLIGAETADTIAAQANTISTNGAQGVSLSDAITDNMVRYATTDSIVRGNTIHGNSSDGIRVSGADGLRNLLSRNSITANDSRGIRLQDGANNDIQAPTITAISSGVVVGTSVPNATVEVYEDQNNQGKTFKGSTVADANGDWSLALADSEGLQSNLLTVVAIDNANNTSEFGDINATSGVIYEIGSDARTGARTIYINGQGSTVTLPEIRDSLQTLTTTVLLDDQGNGTWQANASLFVGRGVTLSVATDTAQWLKLRSQGQNITLAAEPNPYNYDSFVSLRTYNGVISINGTKVTSWDPTANNGKGDFDRDVKNGRSYLLAKYDARMDILNAEIAYLGSPDGESYGLAWRDKNSSEDPEPPVFIQARVTGTVENSNIHHNYYGIYTYQASNMVFRNNTFHNNISYGFDPHDFSNNFLVEGNAAYENGNHGFIISRGCHNFTFRNNKSYNNRYTVNDKDRAAHGFMLDPGSPNSRYAQFPSYENTLEGNQAWGNDGYGLRILGSISNTVTANVFTNNLQGITVEQASVENTITGNTLSGNTLNGIYLIGGSDRTTIKDNAITKNGRHGIYLKTGQNNVTGNTLSDNGTIVGNERTGSGIAFLPEFDAAAAQADFQLPGTTSLAAAAPELQGPPELASALYGNVITDNTLARNVDDGIELKGGINTQIKNNRVEANGVHGVYLSTYRPSNAEVTATFGAQGNLLSQNTIVDNMVHGIRANDAASLQNTWSQNTISGNLQGGIVVTSDANNAIPSPEITAQTATTVAGTAVPNAVVEIFSDPMGQGRYFEGRVTADASGAWSFTQPAGWQAGFVNATATDFGGNSSAFANKGMTYRLNLPFVAQ